MERLQAGHNFNRLRFRVLLCLAVMVLALQAGAQTITITAPDAAAAETGVDPGSFRVTRSGDTASALLVSLSFSGTAVAGSDYEPLTASVTIPSGASSADVTLNPINDATVESSDDTVTATVQPGSGYSVGSPSSATITIANNDAFATSCPLLISAAAASDTSITIKWTDNFRTETKYRVRRSVSADMSSPTGFDAPADATSYTFTGLTPGTVYYFEVRAEKTTSPTASAWSNRASAKAETADTPAFANFEQWRWHQGLDGAGRSAYGGTEDDPDGDSFANLVEYALGGDPLAADDPGMGIAPGNGNVTLSWPEVADLLDLTVTLEESIDLAAWPPSPLASTLSAGIRSASDTRAANKRFYRLNIAPMHNRTPSTTITCWGDSLTAGTSSQPWPGQLAAALGGRTVHNGGIGGETSSQILDRIIGLKLTSPAPAANTPAGTIVPLVASRVVPPRTVDAAYRAQWPAYSAAIANASRVEFLNFGRKIGESSTPLSADATSDIAASATRLLAAGHPFSDGDIVHFSASNLPAPLVTGKPYYVRDADAGGFSLSETSGGAAVALSADFAAATAVTGPFVFKWTHPGGASSLSLRTKTDHDANTLIFWIGRNNLAQPHQVLADLREAIAHIKAMDSRFLVLSVLTQSTEAVGGTNYVHVQNLNARLREEYPSEFVDVRSALLRGGSESGQDATDRAADITPASLRTDTLHLNNAGNQIVAETVAQALSDRGW